MCFSHGLYVFTLDGSLTWQTGYCLHSGSSPFGKDYPYFLSNSTVIKDLILQARYFGKSAFSGRLYNTFTVLTTLSPLNTVMALIRLSWQNLEALQLPWPLVPLNLRSTPFGTHKFSSFEIVTGHPMYLTPSSSDPQLIKKEMVQYLKDLIVFTKNSTCFGRVIFSQCIFGRWRP